MDFLKYRYVFLAVSLSFIIIGLIYSFNVGFKFDIDFKGGTKIQVDLKQDFNNKDIEELVYNVCNKKPLVQKMSGGTSSVSITTEVISEELSDKISKELKNKYSNMEDPSVRNVQPAFGKDLIESAVLAIIAAIVLILIYIGFRFKVLGFTAAVTAIISLVHDALVMLTVYGICGFAINSTFVAVLLTIIGYSINDTIIVYDRIRENKRKVTKVQNLKETINTSISQTMKRTIYTSFTTIATILIVYIFAYFNNQQVLMEFSLPLVIGIIIGTYSSIFIASSLWYIFDKKK
ncbi:MAG: protein translocase subunit SecF [Clostridia bacterium]